MLHGRGAPAEDILELASHLDVKDYALVAPQATNYTWYPYSFLMPPKQNEPWLSSALELIDEVVGDIQEAGVVSSNIFFSGFSQGACLTLEYAARNPQQYGGIVALSGGLIGADDELNGYVGSLNGTPVFMGCSDADSHIPEERVHQSAEIMQGLGATVDVRIYPGMEHTINLDEIKAVSEIMTALVSA